MFRFGLRARFIALLTIILVALFVILTLVIVRQNTNTLRTNLNQKAVIYSELATKPIGDTFVLYKESGRSQITKQTARFYELDADINAISIIDTKGAVNFTHGDDDRSNIKPPPAGSFDPVFSYNQDGMITQIVQPFIEDFGGYRYAIVYTFSTEKIDQQISQISRIIILIGLVFLSASIVLAYTLFNQFFIRPVRELSRLAAVISAGNLEQQIHMKRKDEIGELAGAVNTMAEALKADIVKLQDTDRLKSEFMMITSHNLRTPLSIIRGYVEMSQSVEDSDQVNEFLRVIEANTIRLTEFAEDVITISTFEGGDTDISTELTELKPFLQRVAKEFHLIAATKNISFTYENQLDDQVVRISLAHFKSALWNLLDNAYKFTKSDGNITLSAIQQDDKVVIAVRDSGAGIAEAEIPKLFTKFHRATDTVKYDYEGVGIGLYLTKLVIEKFDGHVNVQSQLGVGSTFSISLPEASRQLTQQQEEPATTSDDNTTT